MITTQLLDLQREFFSKSGSTKINDYKLCKEPCQQKYTTFGHGREATAVKSDGSVTQCPTATAAATCSKSKGHDPLSRQYATMEENVGVRDRTTLQADAGGGHVEVVDELLRADAEVNDAPAPRGGRTALQAAAGSGCSETVERLLTAKTDVNAVAAQIDARTALQAAAEGGYVEVVCFLIEAKADGNGEAATLGGETASEAAKEGGHTEIQAQLEAYRYRHHPFPTAKPSRLGRHSVFAFLLCLCGFLLFLAFG